MSDLPNLRHLSIAHHIGRHHGFSAASKTVNLSPSAITQAMRSLERQLGTEIFDRSPTGAYPNELGRIYLDRVSRAFEALRLAEAVVEPDQKRVDIKSRITISQLRAFISVCACGSYSLAARRLKLSQPSVYKSARSIEIAFDRKLLRPSYSGVDPTPKAKEFARYVSIALSEIERAQEEVHEQQGRMSGRLAIGTLPLVRTRVLPNAVASLVQQFPQANVQVFDGVYSDLLNSLRHGDLDFLLGALRSPLPVKDIEQERLFFDDLNVIVRTGHPILEIEHPTVRDLAKLDWIVPRTGTPTRDYFEGLFANHQISGHSSHIECSSLVAIRAILLASDRATILSSHQAGYEISHQDLAVVNIRLARSQRPIGITTRSNWKATSIQREFLARLKHETQTL
ncbi:MAG: LysR family transcriptional regulator [Pseudomonadota bacterium]